MNKIRLLSVFTIISLLLAACGSVPSSPATSTVAPTAGAVEAPETATEAVVEAPETPTEAAVEVPTDVPVVATAPPPEGGKTQVIWWYEGLGEPEQQLVQKLFIDSFEAANPDIDLAIVYQGSNLRDFLRTAIQGGSGPDIIQTQGPDDIAQYVRAGYVAPLDEYVDLYGWGQKIFPWALDVGKVEGKVYSLPLTYETMVLFYNKKVLDAHDLKPPTSRAELEATANALMDKGIWPFANSQSNGFIMPVLMSSQAGADNVYQGLTGKTKWSDPVLVRPIETFNDWMQKGWFSGNKEAYFSNDYDTMMANFASGKGAMLIMGTWALRQMNENFTDHPDDWDWVQFPALDDNVTPVFDLGIGSTLSINGQSKNKEAAAKVLNWLFNEPKRAAEIMNAMPGEWVVPMRIEPELFPPGLDPRFVRAIETIADASERGNYGYLPWTFWPTNSAEHIYTTLDSVFTQELTPEEWSEELDGIFSGELSEGNVPAIPQRK